MEVSNIKHTNFEPQITSQKAQNTQSKSEIMCQDENCDCRAKVNAEHMKGYINFKGSIPPIKLMKDFEKAVKISDGSAILTPNFPDKYSKIEANEDGTYTVTTGPFRSDVAPTTTIMTEKELLADENICGGLIRKNDDGTYDVTLSKPKLSLDDCDEIIKRNMLHIHS